jgi:hypothetical protein
LAVVDGFLAAGFLAAAPVPVPVPVPVPAAAPAVPLAGVSVTVADGPAADVAAADVPAASTAPPAATTSPAAAVPAASEVPAVSGASAGALASAAGAAVVTSAAVASPLAVSPPESGVPVEVSSDSPDFFFIRSVTSRTWPIPANTDRNAFAGASLTLSLTCGKRIFDLSQKGDGYSRISYTRDLLALFTVACSLPGILPAALAPRNNPWSAR